MGKKMRCGNGVNTLLMYKISKNTQKFELKNKRISTWSEFENVALMTVREYLTWVLKAFTCFQIQAGIKCNHNKKAHPFKQHSGNHIFWPIEHNKIQKIQEKIQKSCKMYLKTKHVKGTIWNQYC